MFRIISCITKRLTCILIAGWLVQALPVHGQNKYSITHYTNENGLPANGIKGIELDKKNGFLWIGTHGGMVRFDGRHFTRFPAGKGVVSGSRVALFVRNREGNIFFADDNFSMNRIDRGQAVPAFADTFFMHPFRVGSGESQTWPAEKIVKKIRSLKPSSFLPQWVLFRDEANDSSSFAFHDFGHGYYFQAKQNRLLDFPGYGMLVKFAKEIYFVRSALELSCYNDSLDKLVPVYIEGAAALKEKEEKRLIWMPGMEAPLLISGRDIWKMTGKKDTLRLQLLCQACCPENGFITNIQVWEEQGLLFLGSDADGLYVVKTPVIHPVRAQPDIEAGKAEYAQVEATPGLITTATGLHFTSEGKLVTAKSRIEFPLSNIYRDTKGDCWFSTTDTIIHLYRDGHQTKIPVNDKILKRVFAEMNGRIYVISDVAIAGIRDDRYELLYILPQVTNNPNSFLNPDDAVEIRPGILAIAGMKLLMFNKDRPAVLDTIAIPGLTVKVRSLLKYEDYLLIGTYGQGFYIYKNGVVKKMPLDINGYLSHAHCFMPDKKGFCWISTNNGLFKVSMHALLTAYEKDLDEIYYHYFGKEDGIFNTEFNGGCQPSALQLSSGLLSFPTMNGMVVLDPLQHNSPPPAGQIFIDGVWMDSALHQVKDGYLQSVPYNTRNLRFKIAVPYFGNAENIYFSYKLEPYNDRWETQDIIQNNIIQFGGLKPGNYTLYLRVRNGFEPDQFGITVVKFQVLKPWYQVWWFYVLCLLGFMTIVWVLVKWRTARIAKRKEELQALVTLQTQNLEQQSKQLEGQLRQLQSQQVRLEEDNNVKARLIGIISHDMISPLKFMSFMSKRLKEVFAESDPSYHTASFIANVAQELESLSVNILNWIKFHHQSIKMKPEKFSLHELVTESVEIPSALAKEKGLSFDIDIPEHIEIVQYRQAIGVIIYNLSMNAMKYTVNGGISIKIQNTAEGAELSVTDTGPGMPPELIKKLNSTETFAAGYSVGETSKYQFGYVIIKDLLRLVDGDMKVSSVENNGTTVTLQFRKMMDNSNIIGG